MTEWIVTAGKVITYAEKLGILDKIISFFHKPCTCIVFGTSGTGKTSFLKSIEKSTADFVDSLNRSLHNKYHDLRLSDERFKFIDTPGHSVYTMPRQSAIRDAIRADRLLILNLVSFGFHETELPLSFSLADREVDPDFLIKSRSLEIEALEEWLEIITASAEAKSIITIVNKADLWWSMRNTVLAYYMSGDYAKSISGSRTPHAVHSYCAHIKRFYDTISCDGEFDESVRRALRSALLENLVIAAASE